MLHVTFSAYWEKVSKTRAISMIREQRICEQDCVFVTRKNIFVYEHGHVAFPATEEVLNELKFNNQ